MSKAGAQLDLGDEIPELASVVRRVVAARLTNPDTVDDVVQETLARVLAASKRLGNEALGPYAVVTARNLVASVGREEARHRRNLHRLVELRDVPRPDTEVIEREEREALGAALARLTEQERAAVLAHEVEGVDTQSLARQLESTPGGVAMRLARARAKLRVEYLLALYKDDPPTARCRPVLTALSAGDRRRQLALGAGEHILECRHCAALAEPLMERRRALAALLPLSAFGRLEDTFAGVWKLVAAAWKLPAVKLAGVGTGLALTVVSVNGLVGDSGDRTTSKAAQASRLCGGHHGALLVNDEVLGRWDASSRQALRGKRIKGCSLEVMSIPSDEGFWVEGPDGGRIWVQIAGLGESPVDVDVRHEVSFDGTVVKHSPAFGDRASSATGAARLRRQGYHIEVVSSELRLVAGGGRHRQKSVSTNGAALLPSR